MCGYKKKIPVFDVVPELKNVPYINLNTIKVLKIMSNLLKKKKYFFTLKNGIEV